jgi:hypothetical protein
MSGLFSFPKQLAAVWGGDKHESVFHHADEFVEAFRSFAAVFVGGECYDLGVLECGLDFSVS